ncbi:hypothetical protein [Antrihabitans sp. YC2-6]|uniref:hypothetical protein n=1 Tax=Antrihabitans sp. YC2-6 TaxID=2799498 RepID=UPI0018F71D58|nr:hypothetical protein [Antrihabitans sp. YC2-6]MBJ8347707.1 hypothetical protein [Antrihabitans sp. YC2-6]
MHSDSLLPADVAAVVARWHPEGSDLLRVLAESPAERSVALVGQAQAGKSTIERALAGDVTFTASPAAAALVVVVLDASAPVGRELLGIIEELAHGANDVLFVLNKIDVHREWRSVRDRNTQLIAARVPRFAAIRILPLSARVGKDDSGVAELRREIGAVLDADLAVARRAQRVRATAAVADLARNRIVAKAESLRPATDVAELRAERTRLVTRRDGGRAESVAALRSQIQLARVELLHDVGSRVRAVNHAVRSEVEAASKDQLRAIPGRLEQAVAALTAEIDASSRQRLGQVQTTVLGTSVPIRVNPAPLDLGAGPQRRTRGLEDRMMVVLGASAGVGLGRLAVAPLSLVPALDIATVPITLLLGGLAAWWLTRSRGHVADKAHMRQWVNDTLVNVKAQLEQRAAGAVVATEGDLADRIVRESAARTAAVDQEIARLDAELRQASGRNAGQLAACERDLAKLEPFRVPLRHNLRAVT